MRSAQDRSIKWHTPWRLVSAILDLNIIIILDTWSDSGGDWGKPPSCKMPWPLDHLSGVSLHTATRWAQENRSYTILHYIISAIHWLDLLPNQDTVYIITRDHIIHMATNWLRLNFKTLLSRKWGGAGLSGWGGVKWVGRGGRWGWRWFFFKCLPWINSAQWRNIVISTMENCCNQHNREPDKDFHSPMENKNQHFNYWGTDGTTNELPLLVLTQGHGIHLCSNNSSLVCSLKLYLCQNKMPFFSLDFTVPVAH